MRSAVGTDLEGIDRVVAHANRVTVGAWRCPASDPRFRNSGPIEHFLVYFPRGRLWIRHQGEARFPVDPNVVTIYNRGQRYTREPIGPDGDPGEWFAVDGETAVEAVREFDPSVEERPDRPFPFSHGPNDGPLYLAQRELFQALERGLPFDPLDLEERVIGLLTRVLALAFDAWRPRWSRRPPPPSAHERDAAYRVQAVLDARFRDPISLSTITEEAGVSRFRLCRVFKATTGLTLQEYRDQLRLRVALDELAAPGVDLSRLALDLGYSSHSHFTANFRRRFGVPPGVARQRLVRGRPRRDAAC